MIMIEKNLLFPADLIPIQHAVVTSYSNLLDDGPIRLSYVK